MLSKDLIQLSCPFHFVTEQTGTMPRRGLVVIKARARSVNCA